MSLWKLYYHIVWATKERLPLILPNQEPELYNYIIGKSDSLNCIVHSIGGMTDHIHVVVSIPPTIAIADFMKKIKGSSSHYLNQHYSMTSKKFYWQEGYGVFSLGSKQLEQAVNYVKNQKIHHLEGTTNPHLEKVDIN
ncbi:IS200/IS605 family transposase [Anabaenopsis sp. FSS-46]|uniref:IS200/IS605 family transposase n=1 Tax=Anabaenopsis sp. FSS-46 TaxID=2971766 RepID=UPI0024764B8B|nr:IS200/IS605 family transposase [Anabaenopsis sp. FSS-46]MDH6099590.1 IS200/IS605 family transposase [Anabaenopsis sp. FSS-46]